MRKDTFGKSDPYVKVQLVNTIHSKKTTHKLSTLNPVWNEVVKLTIQDPKTQSLELQVFDWDKVHLSSSSVIFQCDIGFIFVLSV